VTDDIVQSDDKNLRKAVLHNLEISCEFPQISCTVLYEIITARLGCD
jgi:hypothetical protein